MAKNISFHVGIGRFNPEVYPTATPLKSSRLDAAQMYNLAAEFRYTPLDLNPAPAWDGKTSPPPSNVVLDNEATYAKVVALFKLAADLLTDEGDRCFITMSSHGKQVRNDEPAPNLEGPRDETICLHDFPLRDDVLYGLLSQFAKGVTVILVLDCCHAGASAPQKGTILESVKSAIRDAFFGLVEKTPFSFAGKRPPAFVTAKTTEDSETAAPPLAVELEARFKDFGRPDLQANVVAFQACGANEVTYDGPTATDLSLYTGKFVAAARRADVETLAQLLTAIETAEPKIAGCNPTKQVTPGMDLTTISLRL